MTYKKVPNRTRVALHARIVESIGYCDFPPVFLGVPGARMVRAALKLSTSCSMDGSVIAIADVETRQLLMETYSLTLQKHNPFTKQREIPNKLIRLDRTRRYDTHCFLLGEWFASLRRSIMASFLRFLNLFVVRLPCVNG